MFSVRIVTTDHYLATPIPGLDVTRSDFRGTEVKKVPVLRIFGATPAGQKTCMHVHGVFPYLYIPYDGTKPEDRYMRQVSASLDKALNVGNGMAKTNIQHVFKVSLVSGIPMYGYHPKEELFLKIYLYNPKSIKKAADLLLGGAVMNKSFQPHESHIPYQLQLFIDFNLYGMNLINVAAVKFRKSKNQEDTCDPNETTSPDPLSGHSGLNTPTHRRWKHSNIDRVLYLPDTVDKQSTCELEVDVIASDILNRLEVNANIGTNPGLAAIWEDERQRKRDLGESSQITPQESQEHDDVVASDSENELRLRLLEIIENQQAFPESQSEGEESDISQSDDGGTQTDDILQSSQLPLHLLHRQDSGNLSSSQDTIIVEHEPEETKPVVNLKSIQKVLSFSQSFSQPSSASQTEQGDKSLMDILASLADESPDCSQEDVSQIEALEEEDSIMASKPRLPNHTSIKEDEEETMEMSQIVVVEDEHDDDVEDKKNKSKDGENFDLQGMDDSWTASQWFSDKDDDDDDDADIPQFDGASDKKSGDKPRKRLGTRGPVISQRLLQNDIPPNHYNITPNPYHQSNQQYPSQHNYPSNNEYSHYENPWQTDYNTHNPSYTNQRRSWEQPNYTPLHSPPPVPYQPAAQGPSSRYFPDYDNQQQMYQQQSHQHQTLHHQQQHHQQHSQQHPNLNNNSRQLSSSSHNNLNSAFPHGGLDYRYEAITPPPVQHDQQQQAAPLQSPLRNILTNPSLPYQPSYLNNRSISRSSTHSTSSSGSHHSETSLMKSDDSFHSNPTYQVANNLHQNISERFNNSSQMIEMGTSHQGQKSSGQNYHQNMSTHQQFSNYNQQQQQQQQQQQHHHNKSAVLSPQTFSESFNRSVNNSQEDLFSDSSSFQNSQDNSTSGVFAAMKNVKNELRRKLSAGNIPPLTSPPPTISDLNISTAYRSPLTSSILESPVQTYTRLKNRHSSQNMPCPTFVDSTGLDTVDGSQKQGTVGGSALNNLFNLVSNVSKENIRGLNPKTTPATALSSTVVTNTAVNSWENQYHQQHQYQYQQQQQQQQQQEQQHHQQGFSVNQDGYNMHQNSWNQNNIVNSPQTPFVPNSNKFTYDNPETKLNSFESRLPKVGKKERMKKLGLSQSRIKPPPEISRNAAYSFTFQVPTPVFKRLKFRSADYQNGPELKVVRMHPKDARKYSLLKIGRELVKVPKLTASDIIRFQKLLKYQDMEKQIKSVNNTSDGVEVFDASKIPVKKPCSELDIGVACKLENSTEKMVMDKQFPESLSIDKPSIEQVPIIRNVPIRTEKNKEIKRKSLLLNKKSNNKLAFKCTNKNNNNFFEGDFSHRVIDPDQGDEKVLVLKDVSLRDASEGSLTPIKSQTPVSGRSPAYCSATTEDIYSKTMDDLDIHTHHKIFGNVLLCDKEPMSEVESVLSNTHSGASSRTSSRKESSDSTESLSEVSETKTVKLGKRRHSADSHQTSKNGARSRRSSVNYSPNVYGHLRSIEEEEAQYFKRRKKERSRKGAEVEGVHYVIVGKFKGSKSMRIRLKRHYFPQKTVSATKFLANPTQFQKEVLECSIEENKHLQLPCCDSSSSDLSDNDNDDEFDGGCSSLPEKDEYAEVTPNDEELKNPDPSYESSDSSNSSDFGLMSRSENVSQNISEASSEGFEISEGSKDPKNRSIRRKKLTPNQRLGVAFLTTKARRKKGVSGGKLMSSLSILHQATLANLTETTPAYTDKTDDNKVNYDDVMFKLALFSPPDSDKEDSSPPMPSSPSEDKVIDLFPIKSQPILTAASPEPLLEVKVCPEEIKEKCLKPLEIDVKYMKPDVKPHLSAEGIYETPLSSVETHKAEPAFSPSLASVGSSENDYNAGMPELKDETVAMENDDLENDDFWMEERFSKTQKPPKTAVVKLATLSFSDISSFNAARKNSKEISSSPPDLGPPNIPAYPTHIVSEYLREKSPPPPNLTPNRSPRASDPDALKNASGNPGWTPDNSVMKLLAYRPKPFSPPEIKNTLKISEEISKDNLDSTQLKLRDGIKPLPCETQCYRMMINKSAPADLSINMETETTSEIIASASTSSHNSKLKDNCGLYPQVITNQGKLHNIDKSSDHTNTSGNALDNSKIVSYLKSPSDFVAANIPVMKDVEAMPAVPSLSQRNLWTDITCSSVDSSNEHKMKQKYKKKHEMFNSNGLCSSSVKDISKTEHENNTSNSNPSPASINDKIETKNLDSVIIKPLNMPPLRSTVVESAQSHGLNLTNHKEAFCSNPDDMPDRSREVGGRVIKIESNLVKDLQEFKTSSSSENLKNWRSILAANGEEKLFSSQERESLWERLEKDPQFKFMLSEDRKQVIVPCRYPPSRSEVSHWLSKKVDKLSGNEKKPEAFNKVMQNESADLEYSDRKHFVPLEIETDICDREENSVCNDDFRTDNSMCNDKSGVDNSISSLGCDSMFECSTVIDKDEIVIENVLNTCEVVLSEDGTEIINTSEEQDGSPKSVKITRLKRTVSEGEIMFNCEEEVEILSPTQQDKKSCTRWDQKELSLSKRKNIEFGESDFLHSTPVRRVTKDLFEPSCTPIHIDSNRDPQIKGDGNPPGMFVTPKRPAPPRRISTNTENTLRRSILTSQMKNQLLTPDQSKGDTSQIDGPTPKNSFGFKITQHDLQNAKALHRHQYLTVMSIELHVETRGDHLPDPAYDPIQVIFYSVFNDVPEDEGLRFTTGAIIVDKNSVPEDIQKKRTETPKKGKGRSRSVSPKPKRSRSPQPSTSTADPDTLPKSSSRSRSVSPKPSPKFKADVSPKPSTSKSPKPSTSKSPQPSTSRSPQPSTSRSPQPSTSKANSSQVKQPKTLLEKSGVDNLIVTYVTDEQELLEEFIQLTHKWDPDILVGYEIQMLSLGYILQRAAQLSLNICPKLSRLPDCKEGNRFSAEKDKWGADYNSEIHIAGRIVLNLWRILRHEVTLNIYDFENVAHHVLHRRIPLYSFRSLTSWFNHRTHLYRWRVIDHYTVRVKAILQIIDQLDLIGQTSEFARVFGIEFYDVLSRGSQYRVESMMLRLAKPMNFIPVSPGVHQRARMRAPECIPLTLEPDSKFYTNPVVVLDFQSLYPSIMIAYNYCFSTCLGRLERLAKAQEGQFEFGCTSLKLSPSVIRKLKDDVTISPNGVVFANESVRKGIISKMVEEILNTRIMVKKAMKNYKDDKTLYRMLNARQLGLKLIANVTYGYTGANFSGRMPCIEVGDSIVRKARESLERAIKLVEDTPRWGSRVVYGDTDSLFIEMKGKSKDEAFVIGQEIADAVTNMYPKPMKLKFEKVYLPCVLQTKKRYVGFMYETPDQKEPVFDAKGIETVRRDNCGAVSKVLERCIKLLFTTRDISQVKQYVVRQCQKLLEGKVSLQDCVFAKEYRGMSGYKPGACVPALQIARKRIRSDPRSEPRTGERVPYIIVYGSPGLPLIQLVREPRDMLTDPTLRLNGTYYITKQILPPLNRLFSLIGVDVFSWYQDMPKIIRIVPQSVSGVDAKKGTISQYFATSNCRVCDEQTKQAICRKCMKDPQMVTVVLSDRIRQWERIHHRLSQVCYTCMGCQDIDQPCITLDCPILFRRLIASQDVLRADKLRQDMDKMFDF
ncbi:hypothetical protein SNE40_020308 [Patella caerulea]|uniref:DNA polymerase zeta catalytic subunit n=1 Tax=Patella caerulea TaxID=87958 RepID=A0AAN8G7A0_PATCE